MQPNPAGVCSTHKLPRTQRILERLRQLGILYTSTFAATNHLRPSPIDRLAAIASPDLAQHPRSPTS